MPVENTRWILVDHNKLPGDLGSAYASRVHGVIDHHAEEDAVPQDTEPEPRLLEKSGSCTSLVVRQFKSTWEAISNSSLSSGAGHAQSSDSTIDDSAVTQIWDAQVAKLALASILEDTANLTSSSKTEQVDRESVIYLQGKIFMSPQDGRTWDTNHFYNEIATAKKDIDDLSIQDILRKDYKMWTENSMKLGMSTVVKPLAFLADKAAGEKPHDDAARAFDECMQSYIAERQLAIFAIMTTSTSADGTFQRELLLQADNSAIDAAEKFIATATDELRLEHSDVKGIAQWSRKDKGTNNFWRKVWLQKEIDKSRKQVGPLIRKAMS